MGASRIPILTFHALERDSAPTSFFPALFERAIQKWHAAGWRTISLQAAVRHVREGTLFPDRSFVLTFDDGYASVYRVAFPVLDQYGMTATIFIAPGASGAGGTTALPRLYGREMLSWNEIREMRAHGITFGAHSLTHRDLTRLDLQELEHELRAGQAILADSLGEPIPLFAYPLGRHNARVRALAGQYYTAVCSDRLGLADHNSDLLALERVETFYMRNSWAADGLTHDWFRYYLGARNIPRTLRKIVLG